jgi:hypothetical protein
VALLSSTSVFARDCERLLTGECAPQKPAHGETDLDQAAKAYIKAKMGIYKVCMDTAIGMATGNNTIYN